MRRPLMRRLPEVHFCSRYPFKPYVIATAAAPMQSDSQRSAKLEHCHCGSTVSSKRKVVANLESYPWFSVVGVVRFLAEPVYAYKHAELRTF
jgi:hypothetical protein